MTDFEKLAEQEALSKELTPGYEHLAFYNPNHGAGGKFDSSGGGGDESPTGHPHSDGVHAALTGKGFSPAGRGSGGFNAKHDGTHGGTTVTWKGPKEISSLKRLVPHLKRAGYKVTYKAPTNYDRGGRGGMHARLGVTGPGKGGGK